MMRVGEFKVTAAGDTIDPELILGITVTTEPSIVPIHVSGWLMAEGKRVGSLLDQTESRSGPQSLEASDSSRRNAPSEHAFSFTLRTSLSRLAVDHIQTSRKGNNKGDVHLKAKLVFRSLKSRVLLAYIKTLKMKNESNPDVFSLYYVPSQTSEYNQTFNNLWMLSGDNSRTFLHVETESAELDIKVSSSDWVNDFAPALGLGKYVTIELAMPSADRVSSPISEVVRGAVSALGKMEEQLLRGEWNGVIEASRPIAELLRDEASFKELVGRDGYTPSATNEFFGMIQKLFEFSSKFHHRRDKEKKLQPEVRASKEDAEFIYAAATTLVGIAAAKMRRLDNL